MAFHSSIYPIWASFLVLRFAWEAPWPPAVWMGNSDRHVIGPPSGPKTLRKFSRTPGGLAAGPPFMRSRVEVSYLVELRTWLERVINYQHCESGDGFQTRARAKRCATSASTTTTTTTHIHTHTHTHTHTHIDGTKERTHRHISQHKDV